MLFTSSVISCEFFVLYVCGRQIKWSSFLFRCLAILYDGACVLFITGLIGSLFLCVLCIKVWGRKRANSDLVTRPQLCKRTGTQTIHEWVNNRHGKCYKTFRTQNTKHLPLPAAKQIKHIMTTNRYNTLHKIYQYQFSSNHPYEHKIAAFIFYIHRMITLPITEKS